MQNLKEALLNIVFGHSFIIRPGFFLEHFGNRTLRNVFLSENAIANIERSLSSQRDLLYRVGKEFGFSYASRVPLPHADSIFRDQIFDGLTQLFETVYGESTKVSKDWKKGLFELSGKNLIVCSKNGIGELILLGGWAGVFAYFLKNKRVEGIKPKCQGRGDSECVGLFSVPENLPFKCIVVDDFLEIGIEPRYEKYNRDIPFRRDYGLDMLREVGIVKYQTGTFSILSERFFPIEILFPYLLELRFKEHQVDLTKHLYTPTFEAFENFGRIVLKQKYHSPAEAIDFVCKLSSSFGWGILQPLAKERPFIFIRGFPWTMYSEKIAVPKYFSAFIDGLITGLTGMQVVSILEEKNMQQESYNVTLSIEKA